MLVTELAKDRADFHHRIEIALTIAEAYDVLAVLAQTPLSFFDDEESAQFISDLHKILKKALKEIHL